MSDFPIQGRLIVCLSTIDWNFLWQGHQELMRRFAEAGNDILYVENTGARSLRLSDAPRVAVRLAHWLVETFREPRRPVPRVKVMAPLVLPFPRSRIAQQINDHVILPRLARRIRSLDPRDPLIITFMPTPNARRLIELLQGPRSTLVYHCLADFQHLSDLGDRLEASEMAIARAADVVFVQSADFRRRFAPANQNIHELQFGVNLEIFTANATVPRAPELGDMSRPLLGYVGGLHRHVDFGLLRNVARAFPAGTLVMVGPTQSDPGDLRNEPNVRFLGARKFGELPALLAGFDVGLIPYHRSEYTDTVFPTKLYEYLAMGLPVVSTDLPELRQLRLPAEALRLADGPAPFIAAVAAALEDLSPSAAARRSALARERDWNSVTLQMARVIADRLR